MEIFKERGWGVVIVLLTLRIACSVIQVMIDFGLLKVNTDINFLSISNGLGYLVLVSLVYVAIMYYLKEKK